ncbi:MAG TPA: hypothetical protein DEB71_14000 [Chryseobacterium carnipullorum]|nr:hypothetical protein [Chryseobacterium carnipullorum]HCM33214.1 hypothetical protein [Chryseobacterium sp.]
MILQLQAQTTCFPAIKFRPYSIWDDVSLILIMVSILILYTGFAYYFMKVLKFIINAIKKHFKREKC